MRVAVLIVAAGRGRRAGGGVPKQYRAIGGRPVLTHTVEAALAHPGIDTVRVVIHPEDDAAYTEACAAIDDRRLGPPIPGGVERQSSVRAGLEALAHDPPARVLIHDAARPFLSRATIDRVLDALVTAPAVLPALPIVDALWQSEDGAVGSAVPREDLWRAQTPQGFEFETILKLHREGRAGAPDDVTLAREAGLKVALVLGDGNAFKITLPEDFDRAERYLEGAMDVRTGIGYDVHAFAPGDSVVLNGVRIPHDATLSGHSDADVAMHAVTDAIFGALAEGDIGQWFPPTEAAWHGADSVIFLEKAAERAAVRGYRIAHVDCTIICERPKIGPHAPAMRDTLARVLGVAPSRISVKATTSEGLGFTGRREGIAAQATATLIGP
ncbi:MAG: bifunctional 2-C-methyl-D-erythritol 4-phosphate cytidylyltransferase/2-C-methyl-D-erythritol 2,4-cyclodiphosphate synthase [Pseudomonadota bacterium]